MIHSAIQLKLMSVQSRLPNESLSMSMLIDNPFEAAQVRLMYYTLLDPMGKKIDRWRSCDCIIIIYIM